MAGPCQGTVITHPLRLMGAELLVDLEAALPQSPLRDTLRFDECDVRVALESLSGRTLQSFTTDRCEPVVAIGLHEVKWKERTSARSSAIRFAFALRCATRGSTRSNSRRNTVGTPSFSSMCWTNAVRDRLRRHSQSMETRLKPDARNSHGESGVFGPSNNGSASAGNRPA